jgi:hypothetical protein
MGLGLPSGSCDSDQEFDGHGIDLEDFCRAVPLLLYARNHEDQFRLEFAHLSAGLHEDSEDEGPGLAGTEIRFGGMTVLVPPEDAERVERLAALGFDHAIVAQVYDACGRDENRTQQCLLEGRFP